MGRSQKIPQLLLALSDILLVNLSYGAAFLLRFGTATPNYNLDPYLNLIPWLSLIAFAVFYAFDLYANWRRKSIYDLIYSVIASVLILTLCTMALTFWHRGFAFPRSVISLTAAVQAVLLALSRSFIWLFSKHRYGRKRVLIVGQNAKDGLALAEKFLEHAEGWFVVQDFLPASELKSLELRLRQVDVVLLSPSLHEKVEIINRCAQCHKEVLVVPEAFELFILFSEPQQVDDMLVLSVQPPKLNPGQLMLKRSFDIVVSFTSLLMASPIFLLLYILIPLTSKGPALFKQERLSKDGRPFQILKFRSMVQDAEDRTGPVLAMDKDPRITRIGKFIRATRLDELPQLINVLKGDMSLVGPRPERPFFIKQFEASIPHYSYRMAVKPGITGLAQVMAKYSTTVEDKLRFDLMYVRNYSFAFDLKILLQTIRVAMRREQAGGVKGKDTEQVESLSRLFDKSIVGENNVYRSHSK